MQKIKQFALSLLFQQVPIHVITFSGKDNLIEDITVVSKQTIYNCHKENEFAVSIPGDWESYKETVSCQLYRYITSINQYGIIIHNYCN